MSATTIPIGGIIWWPGDAIDIPVNYQICDGTGGTPDLRNQFVPCAGRSTYAVGDTGGSSTITIPTHSHDELGESTSNPGHYHDVTGTTDPVSGDSAATGLPVTVLTAIDTWSGLSHTHTFEGTIGVEEVHVHGITGTTASVADLVSSIIPSYYAVYFIMRVS